MQDNDQRKIMKKDIWVILLAIGAFAFLMFNDFGRGRTVVYDCRDAHWLPDIPVEVKKECQKIQYEEWKKKLEEENKKTIRA